MSSIISHVREWVSPLEECRQPHAGAVVKSPPAMQEMWVQSLDWEDPLEEEMALLQYSCLGSPMDRKDWQATVHGVAKC